MALTWQTKSSATAAPVPRLEISYALTHGCAEKSLIQYLHIAAVIAALLIVRLAELCALYETIQRPVPGPLYVLLHNRRFGFKRLVTLLGKLQEFFAGGLPLHFFIN